MRENFANHTYLTCWEQKAVSVLITGDARLEVYRGDQFMQALIYRWQCNVTTLFTSEDSIEVRDSDGRRVDHSHRSVYYIKDPFVDWPRRPSCLVDRKSNTKIGEMLYNPRACRATGLFGKYGARFFSAPRIFVLPNGDQRMIESFVSFKDSFFNHVDAIGVCVASRVGRIGQGSIQAP